MKLVDYSDSEASDSENETGSPPQALKSQHVAPPSKPAKKQIIVDLPKPSRTEDEGPLKKRPRTEGTGGLFSILPPPKRSKPAGTSDSSKETHGDEKFVDQNSSEKEPSTTKTQAAPTFVPRSTQTKKAKTISKSVESTKTAASVSLFPLGPDLISKPVVSTPSNPSTYEPLIAQPVPEVELPVEPPSFVPDTTVPPPSTLTTADLDNYASHILEGRHRKNRTIEIVDYNAAEMYAQNAADKASGLLQEQIAPVRAIGTGRHQITQLLNNVQDQRESLEEAFAKGRKVRKESAAKYGW
jgi:hypothetical protein